MKVGIVANTEKDPGYAYSHEIKKFITQRGHDCEIIAPGPTEAGCADFWVVLGGDGTMLRAARYAARVNIPLLGINLGNVGFLADVRKDDGFDALDKALAKNYRVEKRMMLAAGDATALNDVVLKGTRLTRFTVSLDGKMVCQVRADGIIVATPTGSTAYNLSAGGPVLLPENEMMAVTAVSPSQGCGRSWVLEGDAVVKIQAHREASVALDGEGLPPLPAGEWLEIRRCTCFTSIIRTGDVCK
ncbi:MAG: NAD(+)/NADH kinase [Defluviitaleaceae bacterium]|nr:NAD(+)/NADH kinase [Defluviitaleaceae bacterium]MCL2239046.1 NAD(+)/NADH kinase [Defluviitaleaceae bacterium]